MDTNDTNTSGNSSNDTNTSGNSYNNGKASNNRVGENAAYEIDTIYGKKQKVTCIERKYKIVDQNVSFFIVTRKEFDEDTTEKMLHEDMELKTFLANYDITDISFTYSGKENIKIQKKKIPEKGKFEIPEKGKFEIPEKGKFEIPEKGKFEIPEKGKFEIPEKGKFEIPEKGKFEIPEKGKFEIPEKGKFEIPEKGKFEIPEKGKFEIPEKGKFEIGKKEESEATKKRRDIIMNALKRRELFDSLDLPEEFLVKDYIETIEKNGLKISNSAMPYDDLKWLIKKGKVKFVKKNDRGIITYRLIRKTKISKMESQSEDDQLDTHQEETILPDKRSIDRIIS
jgi:hypothetical protein